MKPFVDKLEAPTYMFPGVHKQLYLLEKDSRHMLWLEFIGLMESAYIIKRHIDK